MILTTEIGPMTAHTHTQAFIRHFPRDRGLSFGFLIEMSMTANVECRPT